MARDVRLVQKLANRSHRTQCWQTAGVVRSCEAGRVPVHAVPLRNGPGGSVVEPAVGTDQLTLPG